MESNVRYSKIERTDLFLVSTSNNKNSYLSIILPSCESLLCSCNSTPIAVSESNDSTKV